jgi:hypothetical protein
MGHGPPHRRGSPGAVVRFLPSTTMPDSGRSACISVHLFCICVGSSFAARRTVPSGRGTVWRATQPWRYVPHVAWGVVHCWTDRLDLCRAAPERSGAGVFATVQTCEGDVGGAVGRSTDDAGGALIVGLHRVVAWWMGRRIARYRCMGFLSPHDAGRALVEPLADAWAVGARHAVLANPRRQGPESRVGIGPFAYSASGRVPRLPMSGSGARAFKGRRPFGPGHAEIPAGRDCDHRTKDNTHLLI